MKFLGLSKITYTLSHFLHRFHVTLFVTLAVGSLSIVALFLNQAVTQETADNSTAPKSTFDKATMDKIAALQTSSQYVELTFPSGRVNPFK